MAVTFQLLEWNRPEWAWTLVPPLQGGPPMRFVTSLMRVLLLAVALSAAHPLSATPIMIVGPALEDAFEGSDVVPGLKQLLGPEYTAFRRNFDESAVSVPLKSGGLMLVGWRLGFPDSYGAVVVLHPDGSLDAAYYNAGERTPRYFSNSDQPHHRALQAWAQQYDLPPGHSSITSTPDVL